jgi:hypothetical protein
MGYGGAHKPGANISRRENDPCCPSHRKPVAAGGHPALWHFKAIRPAIEGI